MAGPRTQAWYLARATNFANDGGRTMQRPACVIGFGLAAFLLASVVAPVARAAGGPIVINEVEYDEPSTDTSEYIELKNISAAPVSLAGYSIALMNGATNPPGLYQTITLPNVSLGAGQYYVICANAATVPNCNLDVSPDTNLIQNGAPDAMALLFNGQPIDRVSYEGATPGFTEGAGAPADDGASATTGLSRCADGFDSDSNSTDFQVRPNTPGAANNCGGGGGPIGACGDPATAITAVQGSGSTSPLVGSTVIVEGVVVGDFQEASINGFFIQEEDGQQDGNPATSDGVFVFEGSSTVAVAPGSVVRVQGQVTEFSGLTEITSTTVVVCPASGQATAFSLSFPVAAPVAAVPDLERLEGMLVTIPQTLTVSGNFELGRFGSLDLSAGGRLYQPTQIVAPGAPAIAQQDLNDRSRIVLDDASTTQDPAPVPYKDADNTRRVGDTVTALTGVLDGRLGAYRIHPTVAPTFVSGNPRGGAAAPPVVGGRLRAASFNVLNFFTTLDTGTPICGPTGGLDCRGANTAAELDRQRTKILNALQALDAQVVGLMEIENNASAAVASLVSGLNARGLGPYAFIDTGTIGTDAIKVALIYQSAKVTPVGGFATLTTAVDPRFIDNKNRPALAQTFAEASTGARFTVVVNHLKSKGSACTDIGDGDLGDGQGNCNGTRTQAAAALLSWIAADPTHSGDPDFLMLGDLNSYAKEDPIKQLQNGGLQLLIDGGTPTPYSYQFSGQSGSLDHALATGSLGAQITGAADWHINADEPIAADYNTEFKTDDLFDAGTVFRASDHDPVVVGLALGAPAVAVPGTTPLGRVALAGGLLGLALAALQLAPRRRLRI